MSLLKYFKSAKSGEGVLPNPDEVLASQLPSSTISAANKEVKAVMEQSTSTSNGSKRGKYDHYTPKDKVEIAKRASEHGFAATIRYYGRKRPERPALKESTVRTWKNLYLSELKRERAAEEEMSTTILPEKKRGRPLLLGVELDRRVQVYIRAVRDNGAVVNTAITTACAKGVVKSFDCNLLETNGGHIALTKHWATNLMARMGLVKRRASTKAKMTPKDFDRLKAQFLFDVTVVIEMEEIPPQLVINWDQTGIHYVPVSTWTMAPGGSKRVEIVGIDDKRQITAVFAGSMSGEFLPPQLIYKGKTPKCQPSGDCPSDWHVTYTGNHWSNEKTMLDYLQIILFPYIDNKRSELKLDSAYPALVISDCFRGQCTETVLSMLREQHIYIAIVPANCTDRLQPLDLSVNKAAKECLRRQFQTWYSDKICSQLQEDPKVEVTPVNLNMSIVKPLSLKWMKEVCDYLKSIPEIIVNGFKEAGITSSY